MKKAKLALTCLCLAVLSGCTMPTGGSSQYQTQNTVYKDYKAFCNVDMTQVVPGNYLVEKNEQKYFYIDSDGNIYSNQELNKLKEQQGNINIENQMADQVKNKFAGALNTFIGTQVVQESAKPVDISTIKQIVVKQFSLVKNPSQHYCTADLSSNYNPENFTAKRYILKVTQSLNQEQNDEMNINMYNDIQNSNVYLTPLK